MSENTETFDPTKELLELGQKFVDCIFALPSWFSLVCQDSECDLERFLETATGEEQNRLVEYSKTIMDCEKHLSNLQERMIELELGD